MNPETDEKVFYLHEVRQILYGLLVAHSSAPWWIRWYYKPWNDALKTAMLILDGEQIIRDQKESDALKDWADQL